MPKKHDAEETAFEVITSYDAYGQLPGSIQNILDVENDKEEFLNDICDQLYEYKSKNEYEYYENLERITKEQAKNNINDNGGMEL